MFKKQVATKEYLKLMIALSGPSGAGKTYSALHLAYGITGDWSKIVVIDTENGSARNYAGSMTGPWEHIDFPPDFPGGYHPNNWIKLIEFVESDPKTEVLILDSISHEWSKKGGALDFNNKLGGKFTDWSKTTPIHDSFFDKMRSSRLHIIATMRSKHEYIIEQNEKGKSAPRKVGLKPDQREGTEYEFSIMFDIQMNHFCTVSKDRTGIFAPRSDFQISKETGKDLVAWSKEGEVTKNSPKPLVMFNSKEDAPKLEAYLVKNFVYQEDRNDFLALMDGRPFTPEEVMKVGSEIRTTMAKREKEKPAIAPENVPATTYREADDGSDIPF